MLFQVSSGAIANTLLSSEVERRLQFSPELEKAIGSSKHQYKEVDQLDVNSQMGLYSAEDFYSELYPSVTDNNKYVGTKFAQLRLIRGQIYSLLGRQLIDVGRAGFATEAEQIASLYQNAKSFALSGHSFGEILSESREAATDDMIWPEYRTIESETVVVPVLYLTSDTYQERKVSGQQVEFGGNLDFGTLELNDVDVKFARESFVNLAGGFKATNTSIEANEALKIIAAGDFELLSSQIDANGDVSIGAHSVTLNTIVHRFDYGQGTGTRVGEITSINSAGDIFIKSYSDISVLGSGVHAPNGAIKFDADGNIYIGTKRLTSSFQGYENSWNVDRSDLTFLQSSLTAQDNIELMAKGVITLDAAELVSSQGSIKILAGLGITIIDALGQSQETASAKFGKKEIDTSVYQTVAIRSLLDAGKDIQLSTDYGDINLRSVDITSQDGTQVKAKNGGVNLLMTTETDHYSYSSVKEGMFTVETKSYGHNRESGVPNTIVGGLAVEALTGITVEYTGDPELTVSEQIDVLNGFEGLDWMAQLRDENSAEFLEVMEVDESWYESDTTLSPAAIAVLTIAVAIAAGPAAGQFAATVGAGATTTVLGAATAAGFTSIVTTASISLANGNSLESTLKSLSSKDNMKSLAVSMVTAGAIAGANSAMADTAFFQADTNSINSAVEAGSTTVSAVTNTATQGLTQQLVQATVNSAVTAGVSVAINEGSLSDFGDEFAQNLATRGVAYLGQELAQKIGGWHEGANFQNEFDVSDVARYLAHAATGCLTGSLTAEITNESPEQACTYGAGGAVVGEMTADIYAESQGYYELEAEGEELNALLEESLGTDFQYMSEEQMQNLTPEQWGQLAGLNNIHETLNSLKANGTDLARLSAAMGAFVAGAEAAQVNIAADAGENAAANNAFFLIPLIQAGLFIWTAVETVEAANKLIGDIERYNSGEMSPEEQAEILEDLATDAGLAALGFLGAAKLEKVVDFLRETKAGLIVERKLDEVIAYLENKNNLIEEVTDEAGTDTDTPYWKQRLVEGNQFNEDQKDNYPYSEVYIEKTDGEATSYYRLDSYDPEKGEIVSRKHTQLSNIQETTAKKYINELTQKYPDGATIANVPSSGSLSGETLVGQMILEVPVQNVPVPQAVISAADNAGVIIRDINGTIY